MFVKCSTKECGRKTFFPFQKNPRQRWLVGIILVDHDGIFGEKDKEVAINLCPGCAKEQFGLSEEDYIGLERMEHAVAARVN